MQLGMIGLGRMGGNIVRRLMRAGHSCVVYDKSTAAVQGLAGEGAAPRRDPADFVRQLETPRAGRGVVGGEGAARSGALADFVGQLETPRAVWVMLRAGAITHATIDELSGLLEPADI